MTLQDTTVKMRPVTREEMVRTAYHEAGHATVALVLMPQLISQAVLNEEVAVGRRLAETDCRGYYGWVNLLPAKNSDEIIECYVACYAAGKIGERIGMRTEPPRSADRLDRKYAREMCREHSTVRTCKDDPAEVIKQLRANASHRAERILVGEKELFVALTYRLLDHLRLDHDELLELLGEHTTGRTY